MTVPRAEQRETHRLKNDGGLTEHWGHRPLRAIFETMP
jgi:hypothetical protein